MKLAGAITLITGGGRGIGRTLALSLAREGAEVVLTARTQSELDLVCNEIVSEGGKAHALAADLRKDQDIGRIFDHIRDTFGRLDILVNNAVSAGLPRSRICRSRTLTPCGTSICGRCFSARSGPFP